MPPRPASASRSFYYFSATLLTAPLREELRAVDYDWPPARRVSGPFLRRSSARHGGNRATRPPSHSRRASSFTIAEGGQFQFSTPMIATGFFAEITLSSARCAMPGSRLSACRSPSSLDGFRVAAKTGLAWGRPIDWRRTESPGLPGLQFCALVDAQLYPLVDEPPRAVACCRLLKCQLGARRRLTAHDAVICRHTTAQQSSRQQWLPAPRCGAAADVVRLPLAHRRR